MEITESRITTPEGVGGFLAYPKGQTSPGVVVHFEIFGVNGHIEEVCRRVAAEGYAALAPDYYWRLERRTAPYTDLQAAFAMAGTLKDAEVMSDATSCVRYLQSQSFVDSGAIGSLGFCMGGRLSVLTAAANPDAVTAAVSFYGGGLSGENPRPGRTLNPMDEAAKVKCPLLLVYGGSDQHILPEHVDAFTSKLSQLGKRFTSHVYPGAGHGFFCSDRPSYHADASKDAWEKVKSFFEANLKRAAAAVR